MKRNKNPQKLSIQQVIDQGRMLEGTEFETTDRSLLKERDNFKHILRTEIDGSDGKSPARTEPLQFSDIVPFHDNVTEFGETAPNQLNRIVGEVQGIGRVAIDVQVINQMVMPDGAHVANYLQEIPDFRQPGQAS